MTQVVAHHGRHRQAAHQPPPADRQASGGVRKRSPPAQCGAVEEALRLGLTDLAPSILEKDLLITELLVMLKSVGEALDQSATSLALKNGEGFRSLPDLQQLLQNPHGCNHRVVPRQSPCSSSSNSFRASSPGCPSWRKASSRSATSRCSCGGAAGPCCSAAIESHRSCTSSSRWDKGRLSRSEPIGRTGQPPHHNG